nr:MAG TPA: hypothetical protein [Corticoviridae sp.]
MAQSEGRVEFKTVLNFWRPFVWPLFFGLQNDTFKI